MVIDMIHPLTREDLFCMLCHLEKQLPEICRSSFMLEKKTFNIFINNFLLTMEIKLKYKSRGRLWEDRSVVIWSDMALLMFIVGVT